MIATTSYRLAIAGHEVPLTADYSIRFVENNGGRTTPVLYFQGHRVVKAWTIELVHEEPADKHGGNANTC
jgi:hypothetical protein